MGDSGHRNAGDLLNHGTRSHLIPDVTSPAARERYPRTGLQRNQDSGLQTVREKGDASLYLGLDAIVDVERF